MEILDSSTVALSEAGEPQTTRPHDKNSSGRTPDRKVKYIYRITITFNEYTCRTELVGVSYAGVENGGPGMAKEQRIKAPVRALKYNRVEISSLSHARRGKHYDLVQGILHELNLLPDGSALEIPLTSVGDIGLANLRSAVHRAAASAGLAIETVANEENFYVWKAVRK